MAGLTFDERMVGPFVMGVDDPREGARRGRRTDWRMTLQARVAIDDVDAFVAAPSPTGDLSGELHIPGIRRPIPFDGGTFRLFPPGVPALMTYEFGFRHGGEDYHLEGRKCSRTLPLQVWSDTTTLEVRLQRGTEPAGAGMLHIGVGDFARVLASMRSVGAGSPVAAGGALAAYYWLFARKLGMAYLPSRARVVSG